MISTPGPVAVVTGAMGGIGAAVCRRLTADGFEVVAADLGGPYRLDVTSEIDWAELARFVTAEFGRLDVLVSNAGIVHRSPIASHSLAAWEKVMAVNATGTFLGARTAVPLMTASGGGSIVNVSSTAGMHGVAYLPAYTASKFAVRGLTKSLALELAPQSIRVNSVHPGSVHTAMTEGFEDIAKTIPAGRLAEPEEIADLIAFLASPRSAYCTGAEFVIDGGDTAGRR